MEPIIKVTSSSFSKSEDLRSKLLRYFPDAQFNQGGDKLGEKELLDFIKDADGIIVSLDKIDYALLKKCPNLKIIGKYGVGLDNIDLKACERLNIKIGWTPGVNKLSVAEQTIALMICLLRNLFRASYQLRENVWNKSGGSQLSAKTVGIIGVGNIGREVVRLLKPFDCKILANDIIDQTDYYVKNGLQETSKEAIFRNSDIVTIHTPLNAETEYLVNKKTLGLMKNTSFLINNARGKIVKLEDLKEALKNGVIAGAALDVYEDEPPKDLEFLRLPNLICTPHIGGNSIEAVKAMGLSAISHLREFFGK